MPRATVAASLRVDPDFLAGADPDGRLRLYAPDPVDPGSSISHWDSVATPDLLMEPAIGGNVEIGDLDLTLDQLRDIGWSPGSSNIVGPLRRRPRARVSSLPTRSARTGATPCCTSPSIWGGLLGSGVTIHIDASFDELDCGDDSAVLAQAGPEFIYESFAGADVHSTWYPGALAEALSGQNLSLEDDSDPDASDISATFNSRIDEGCIGGGSFSYNLAGNAPGRQLSFVNVALHELAHGLGFVSLVNESTGANPFGMPDIFSVFTLDTTSGRRWNQMTNAERVVSATNTGRLVWAGPNVRAAAPELPRRGVPILFVASPNSVDGGYEVATAEFGPSLSSAGRPRQSGAGRRRDRSARATAASRSSTPPP